MLFRVAIDHAVTQIHVVRIGELTLMVRPALMLLTAALAQGAVLMTRREIEAVRAAVPAPVPITSTADYADALPTLTCPCTVPPSLRAEPWPTCPIHNPDMPGHSVVEHAEHILRVGEGPISTPVRP